jgi:hypothetical protein
MGLGDDPKGSTTATGRPRFSAVTDLMSVVGHNRTCGPSIVMSALLRLTDSSRTLRHVRKVPKGDIAHLV